MPWVKKNRRCPVCRGNLGWWTKFDMEGKKMKQTTWIRCSTCSGTGVVEVWQYDYSHLDTEEDQQPPWERE